MMLRLWRLRRSSRHWPFSFILPTPKQPRYPSQDSWSSITLAFIPPRSTILSLSPADRISFFLDLYKTYPLTEESAFKVEHILKWPGYYVALYWVSDWNFLIQCLRLWMLVTTLLRTTGAIPWNFVLRFTKLVESIVPLLDGTILR